MGIQPYRHSENKENKWCSYAEHYVHESKFGKDANSPDGLKYVCKSCDKIRNQDKPHKKNAEERRKRNKELIELRRSAGCVGCGETDTVLLDFHHLVPRAASMYRQAITAFAAGSVERLIAEIDKCIVVCANCHRRLENKRMCVVKGRIGGDVD